MNQPLVVEDAIVEGIKSRAADARSNGQYSVCFENVAYDPFAGTEHEFYVWATLTEEDGRIVVKNVGCMLLDQGPT